MTTDESAAYWDESAAKLVIHCPAAEKRERSGWDLKVVLLATCAAILFPMLLVEQQQNLVVIVLAWIAAGAVLFVAWYCYIYAARHPQPREYHEASSIAVDHGKLYIEQAGANNTIASQWDVEQVVDVRLCPTADFGRIVFGMAPVVGKLLQPRGPLVRIRVMLRTGAVEDVVIVAPDGPWICDVEERLRHFLGFDEAVASG